MKESRGRGFAVHFQGLREVGIYRHQLNTELRRHETGNLLEGCDNARILVIASQFGQVLGDLEFPRIKTHHNAARDDATATLGQ